MNIDCQYVRQLVRTQPIQPGSIEQQFVDHHLTKCPACREVLNIPSPTLLGSLLDTEPPRPMSHPLYHAPAKQPRRAAPAPDQPAPAKQPRRAAPAPDQPAPAKQPRRAAPAPDQPAPAKQPRRAAPASWTWQRSVVLTIATIVVSYVVITGIKVGWDVVRIWQGLGVISNTTTPTSNALPTIAPADTTPNPTATVVVPTPAPAAIVLPAGSDQPLTVLLLGSDRRPQETGVSRTDAVILMRINPQTKKISMLSFPRDLMVNIPGYGWARINAANVYGDLYPNLGGGRKLAAQTVSNLIGQPIDYTVLIDFAGFIDVIDTLGGVPVDVPKELYDAQFPTMDYKYREAYFPVGTMTMNGDTALTYSRIRHPDNDFERTTRQQSVIIGIGNRLMTDGYLATLDKAASITDALIGHAQTDMPRDKIVALAWLMRDMDTTQVSKFTFRDIYYGTGNDRYAMYAVDGAIDRIVAQWLAQ